MRLTVGSLPAAVYWRRRGVVVVGLAMAVLIVFYACGGPGSNAAAPGPTGSVPVGSSSSPAASSSTSAQPTTVATSTSPSPTAFTLPVGGATGPCTDAELELTATAAAAQVKRSQQVAFTLKIKNISTRTCVRDVGADAQELQLRDGTTVIWSSDDCNANHGHDEKQFTPGFEVSYTRTWPGLRSRNGTNAVDCTLTLAPIEGVYSLLARLDQKYSAAFALYITSS